MEITIQHVRSVTCTIGGALEHQKVKNQQKLKCTKNTLLIYQIVALHELIKINTTRWCDFDIRCPKNVEKADEENKKTDA